MLPDVINCANNFHNSLIIQGITGMHWLVCPVLLCAIIDSIMGYFSNEKSIIVLHNIDLHLFLLFSFQTIR